MEVANMKTRFRHLQSSVIRLKVASLAMGSILFGSVHGHALPDLIIYGPAAQPTVVTRAFNSDDCEVSEGCVMTAGVRRLLSFSTEVRNLGPSDLVFGDPNNNPLFTYDPCHGHHHFEGFAGYRLLDTNNNVVKGRQKAAFCMEDSTRWSPAAPRLNRYYNCNNQGISVGWADTYDPAVACQFMDITDVPDGDYILELEMDPFDLIAEANQNNNITRVNVTLTGNCPSPPNDTFFDAQVLTGLAANAIAFTTCAAKEIGEPNHATNSGGHSVWFRWTAPQSAPVEITTIGSDFDTLLAVYTGSDVGALSLVAANDDIVFISNGQSRVVFDAVAQTAYQIAVDGWDRANGRVVLNINPPPNDAFTNCLTITGLLGTVSGHNIGATKEPNEPAHHGNIGGHSVWYCWTAPTNTPVLFDTVGSDFDTTLAVYTGNSVGSLTLVKSDDNSGGNSTSRLSFNAAADTTYRIAVDGFSGTSGTIALTWNPPSEVQLAIRRWSPGAIQLNVTGPSGRYQIHSSSNLVGPVWTTNTSFDLTGSSYEYTDSVAESFLQRFYRAVFLP